MLLSFYKYEGCGNDFILIDNRSSFFDLQNTKLIHHLCDRRFGIGADGLMLLQNKEGYDFEMKYYNADGREGSMCGNGGRCITAFAKHVSAINNSQVHFIASDGPHDAILVKEDYVSLKMKDVDTIETNTDFSFLDTGSPHYVALVDNIEQWDVFGEGKKIRYNSRFAAKGTNVNFIQRKNDRLFVRTYERGVEDETYACGTGVTAAALVASEKGISTSPSSCAIQTLGGPMNVKFNPAGEHQFNNIWLEGPATFVFKGEISI